MRNGHDYLVQLVVLVYTFRRSTFLLRLPCGGGSSCGARFKVIVVVTTWRTLKVWPVSLTGESYGLTRQSDGEWRDRRGCALRGEADTGV